MRVIYDFETYRNMFCGYFGNTDTRKCYHFEISDRKNELDLLVEYLFEVYSENGELVGFNNLGFDAQVLEYILENQKSVTSEGIYNKATEIIKASDEERFKMLVPPWKLTIPNLDLYKIWHFDNKARATSLKILEFNMRSDNIEDLPYPPDKNLTDPQKDEVLAYNKHDMVQTFYFYQHSLDQIRFREELSRKYKRNFMNHNDTKIGKDYFIMRLEENSPGCCYKHRKVQQTRRKEIDLGECILDYIKFDRPEFQAVKDWVSKQVITKTKGVFSDILESEVGELSKFAEMRTKKKKYPSREEAEEALFPDAWIEDYQLQSGGISHYLKWNVLDKLNTVVDGFQFDFGTGGIHGSLENTVIDTDDDGIVVDKDVSSYYPNLAIVNGIYPEHLGEEFVKVYKDVYQQRKGYAKGTPENAMMKLALNGVYGDSNNFYSPFYDPKFTMTITISGQLSLCMLAEKLLEVPTLKMIQINTDGLTYKVSRGYKEQADNVCQSWEGITGLELEENLYRRMAIRDVNSYLALDFDGKIKQKGDYQYEELGWHQNQSCLVVPLAAKHALIDDGDVETFIKNHKNKYDFMLRTKVPRNSRLVGVDEDGAENPLQNITRYYVSNEGLQLVKIMPPLPDKTEERRIGIETGHWVKTCNNIKDFDWDVNFDYYVKKAEKLVEPLLN